MTTTLRSTRHWPPAPARHSRSVRLTWPFDPEPRPRGTGLASRTPTSVANTPLLRTSAASARASEAPSSYPPEATSLKIASVSAASRSAHQMSDRAPLAMASLKRPLLRSNCETTLRSRKDARRTWIGCALVQQPTFRSASAASSSLVLLSVTVAVGTLRSGWTYLVWIQIINEVAYVHRRTARVTDCRRKIASFSVTDGKETVLKGVAWLHSGSRRMHGSVAGRNEGNLIN